MANEPGALSFLRETLGTDAYAEFVRRLRTCSSGILKMNSITIGARIRSGEFAQRNQNRAYRIGPPRCSKSIPLFPPNDRILALALEYLSLEANLEILERGENEIVVRVAACTVETQRKRFAAAVARETHFLR